ncbi:bifunctional DNA-formamidopyrimidine glycosylase/DNA-(apurinic or apyrimidinic site) lyase [Candidatus Nomurabacteria bacterium]|nr:bifunctional DNA-formamidopyrimidine glycosylase/DNA-(apurinic or apyrimidinic site) lyase [Candidatus Nomurabacteria bacterium]
MPELPEVENLRRGLEKHILGQKIKKVLVNKPKLVSGKGNIRIASSRKVKEFIEGLTHEKFIAVERRAKNLIFKLSHNKIILAHLKMSGQFAYLPSRKAMARRSKEVKVIGGHPIEISEKVLPNKHTHIIFELEHGTLYYNDTRMFGYVLYFPSLEILEKENHFANLGKEPLDKSFTVKYFAESLKNKKGKIKSVLMGQDVVVGVGNIYTDESLFESGILPTRTASSLNPKEIEKLYKAIVRIISKAITVGGSSVATYRLIDDSRGNYAREHKVYGKSGNKCSKCKTTLKKTLIQTRTTVFCPHCQK